MRIELSATLAAALLAVLALAGCGEEEKGEAEYFPMATGNTWEYLETYDDTTHEPETTRHTVSGKETITDFDGNEVETWVVANNPNVETDEARVYWIVDDGITVRRIRQTVDSEGDGAIDKQQDYVPGITKIDRGHLVAGDSWNDEVLRHTTYPSDPSATQESKLLLYEWSVVSTSETVVVPAGTFDNCLRVERNNTADASNEETKIYWFAPGVGKVKEQTVAAESDNKVEELTSYEVDVQD